MRKSTEELLRERLDRLFDAADKAEAAKLLAEDCGANLPLPPSENDFVRVKAAALKCSGGTIEGLVAAITLAQTDWRDLLVVAGFGYDTGAHIVWLQSAEAGQKL